MSGWTRASSTGARSSGRLRRTMHPQTPHQRKTASPAAGAGHAGDDALGNLPYNPCGCEIAVQKGSTPSNTAPPAVGCAVRTKEKISDAALFPDVSGHQGGAALPGAGKGLAICRAHAAPGAAGRGAGEGEEQPLPSPDGSGTLSHKGRGIPPGHTNILKIPII